MADDLTRPLGLKPPRGRSKPVPWMFIGGGAAIAIAVIAGGVFLLRPDAPGPTATAVIDAPPAPAVAERTGSTKPIPPPSTSGLSEIKPSDGGLTEVGKVVIRDPSEPAPMQLASLPEAGLVENSPEGPLPQIASDGTRALDAYARPSQAGVRETRIAIVLGGIGIDADSTDRAIELPGAVTLAMAPYGGDLQATLTDARAAGHEMLLQIPLEPFNYPKTDPGPHTLTVDASPEENLDRLHWLMSRTTNYVGVVNYMGGRFTGESEALAPVIADVGKRGLLYLDDGSSARSRAAELAGGTPVVRADMVLDADLSPAAIDARLEQLRAIARERGYAIATGTAFPATIDRVAEFARTAADRGVTIVPLSALAAAGRS